MHGSLATGSETYIRDGQGKISWRYPHPNRDGWVLPGGNVLLALSKGITYPGGGVVVVNTSGRTVFEYKGTQSEVNTARRLDGGNARVFEAGERPHLAEVDRQGRVIVEAPI